MKFASLSACLLSLALSLAGPARAQEEEPPGENETPSWAEKIKGYASVAEVRELAEPDRQEFLVLIEDKAWAGAHRDYLQDIQKLKPEEFQAARKDKRGEVLLEWLRERRRARAFLDAVRKSEIYEDSLSQLKTYAKAGFFDLPLTVMLLGEDSPVVENLRQAARAPAAGSAEADAAEAGRVFDGAAAAAEKDVLGRLRFRKGGKPEPAGPERGLIGTELLYRTGREMVMHPADFRKRRPELFLGAKAAELKAQEELIKKLGHVYETADLLLSQGKLEISWGIDSAHAAVYGMTSIEQRPGEQGEPQWKIIVRINGSLKDVDPALVVTTLTHELQHAYDDYAQIQKYGRDTAMLLQHHQEEEMRAFVSEGPIAAAYAVALASAAAAQPENGAAQSLFADSQRSRELETDRVRNRKSYEAVLARLARNILKESGYATDTGGGIPTIKGLKEAARDRLVRLRAEKFASEKGEAALKEEIARAEAADEDPEYMAALKMVENRDRRPLGEIEREIARKKSMLAAIEREEKRGLTDLTVNGERIPQEDLPRLPRRYY